VAHAGREEEVLTIFRKWELPAIVIGQVTSEPFLEIRRHGRVEARLNPHHLADECPTYHSVATPSPEFLARANFDPTSVKVPDLHQALLTLLAHPDVASKRAIFEQYDRHVQTQTIVDAGQGDAAVLHPDGTDVAVALTIDGNSRWTEAHPRRGGRLAVAEAARNIACSGGCSLAITDGLNFGSPEDPHVFYHFREAVLGIAEAADAMGTPVISGNVSLRNESEQDGVKRAIPATPLVGMVGLIADPARVRSARPVEGDTVYLLDAGDQGSEHGGLGASLLLSAVLGREDGYPDDPDLGAERRLGELLAALPSGP
ncbi:MAG: phosphoribosylformylglycinamidine synthase II, partial [Armatimonadota bacterium]